MTVRLPEALVDALDRRAAALGVKRTPVMIDLLERSLGEPGQQALGTPEPSVTSADVGGGPEPIRSEGGTPAADVSRITEEHISARMERLRPRLRMDERRLRSMALNQLQAEAKR